MIIGKAHLGIGRWEDECVRLAAAEKHEEANATEKRCAGVGLGVNDLKTAQPKPFVRSFDIDHGLP
jgi:hypothetical protein